MGKEDLRFQWSRRVGKVWAHLTWTVVLYRPAGTHSGDGHTIYHLTLHRTSPLTPSHSNLKEL